MTKPISDYGTAELHKQHVVELEIRSASEGHAKRARVMTQTVIDRMLANESISRGMWEAGNWFMGAWEAAGRRARYAASGTERIDNNGRDTSERLIAVDQAVEKALRHVGAESRSILIQCVGNQETLEQWVFSERAKGKMVNTNYARGLMVGTLSALAAHRGIW